MRGALLRVMNVVSDAWSAIYGRLLLFPLTLDLFAQHCGSLSLWFGASLVDFEALRHASTPVALTTTRQCSGQNVSRFGEGDACLEKSGTFFPFELI